MIPDREKESFSRSSCEKRFSAIGRGEEPEDTAVLNSSARGLSRAGPAPIETFRRRMEAVIEPDTKAPCGRRRPHGACLWRLWNPAIEAAKPPVRYEPGRARWPRTDQRGFRGHASGTLSPRQFPTGLPGAVHECSQAPCLFFVWGSSGLAAGSTQGGFIIRLNQPCCPGMRPQC